MSAPIIEADTSASMLNRVRKILERAELMANMRQEDIDKLDPAQQAARLAEIEQAQSRAAELIAKYGIDRAVLAASGAVVDGTVDRVIMAERPFASKMQTLLTVIVDAMGGKARHVKTWNKESGPKAKGGIPRGGYDFGVRVFAYASDLERIELLYASLRNQALAGVSRVVNKDTEFGQAQKADRESYLDGWVSGLYRKLQQAERDARERAEAEETEARDRAMEDGQTFTGPSVALVLADRKTALDRAYDLAQGITPEMRIEWAKDSERYREEAAALRAARAEEIADCKRCQRAKSGRCNDHRERSYGRSYRAYERTGTQFGNGYADGQQADLGPRGPQVDSEGSPLSVSG